MPTTQQHINQWKRNRDLLVKNNMGEFPEWKVTVGFYCALHAIETMLAGRKPPQHFKRHTFRNEYLAHPNSKLLQIWTPYKALFDAASEARYNCIDIAKRFKPPILHELLQKQLRSIEMFVIRELGLTESEFPHIQIDKSTGHVSLPKAAPNTVPASPQPDVPPTPQPATDPKQKETDAK
jgi:hypothetical protein